MIDEPARHRTSHIWNAFGQCNRQNSRYTSYEQNWINNNKNNNCGGSNSSSQTSGMNLNFIHSTHAISMESEESDFGWNTRWQTMLVFYVMQLGCFSTEKLVFFPPNMEYLDIEVKCCVDVMSHRWVQRAVGICSRSIQTHWKCYE